MESETFRQKFSLHRLLNLKNLERRISLENMDNTDQFFNKCIFYISSCKLGPLRKKLFQNKIQSSGGQIIPEEDQSRFHEITHILFEQTYLSDHEKCLYSLKKLNIFPEIVNRKIRVIGSDWISECFEKKSLVDSQPYEFILPSIDREIESNKRKFEIDIQPESSKKNFRSINVENFKCSQSSKSKDSLLFNQHLIDELNKLYNAFKNTGDTWRSYSYAKAISSLKSVDHEISNYEEARALPGVGERMAAKIVELLETGSLRKVEEICNEEKTKTLDLFNKIWGVGPTISQAWYQQGLRTLEDLNSKSTLTKQQKIGLTYFEDINSRIPREEVYEIFIYVRDVALALESSLELILCGSYRRGSPTCGDIDILVINSLESDILFRLVNNLKSKDFLLDDLTSMENEGDHKKYLGLCKLPKENSKCRRIDIFVIPHSEKAPALMHYTGSSIFNRSIRLLASKKGMSLSENGLFKGILREGQKKLNKGNKLDTPTEESIFEHLGLEYKTPEERNH